MDVGTRVRILVGIHKGFIGFVEEIIRDDNRENRYDITCSPGRWYYEDELEVVEEDKTAV